VPCYDEKVEKFYVCGKGEGCAESSENIAFELETTS
jgi:hypothetical protein